MSEREGALRVGDLQGGGCSDPRRGSWRQPASFFFAPRAGQSSASQWACARASEVARRAVLPKSVGRVLRRAREGEEGDGNRGALVWGLGRG